MLILITVRLKQPNNLNKNNGYVKQNLIILRAKQKAFKDSAKKCLSHMTKCLTDTGKCYLKTIPY